MIEMIRDNIVPFLMAFIGIIIGAGVPKAAISLLKISFVVLAIQGAWLFVLPMISKHLGFAVGFNFSRFSIYVPFILVMAGAMCVDRVQNSWRLILSAGDAPRINWELRKVLIICAVTAVIVHSIFVNAWTIIEAAEGNNFANFFRHRAFELVAAKTNQEQPFRVATLVRGLGNSAHPGFSWGYSLESVDGYLSNYPRRYQEYWGEVLRPLLDLNNRISSYFWSWGCRVYLFSPNFFAPHGQGNIDARPLTFSDWYNLNLISLANAKYIVSPVPIHDSNLSLILSPTDEQIVWRANPSRFEKLNSFFKGKSPGFPLYVYENLLVLQRFFQVGKTITFEDKAELLDTMRRADHTTLSSHAFVLASDVSGLPLQRLRGEKGEIIVRNYSFDKMDLVTNCDSPCILIATNSWSPYWKAWINKVETRLFPVDHTFQGLYCPAGHHEIALRYLPPYRLGSISP
jgi:hypothetical protein